MSRLRVDGLFASGPRRYESLLEDPLVTDWIDVYRSASTKEDYLRSLYTVYVRSKLLPGQLLDLGPDDARRVVMDVAREYVREDKLVSARMIQTAVKSFHEHHDRVIKFKHVDRIRYVRKKIAYEVIPSKEQIYRMADAFKKQGKVRLRSRVVILCLFQSGVRVNCLLNWRIGMVRDQLYPEIKIPVHLKITNAVDTKLSGYGLSHYHTFLQGEAAQALRD